MTRGDVRAPSRADLLPLVVAAVLTAGLAAASIAVPPLAAVAVAVPFLPLYLRRLPLVALALLTGAPLLLSGFTVGPLTLDNEVTLVGLASALIWALQQRRVSLPAFSVFPLLMAVAVGISGAFAGVDSLAGVIRFTGLAFVPALIVGGAVPRLVAERIMLAELLVGAVSVITQPVDPFIPVYVDPQTGASRFGGLMGHPNFAAYAIGMGILYLLARRRVPARLWALVAVFGLAIAMTSSMAALATVAAGALVLLARTGVVRVLAVVAAAGIGLVAVGGTIFDRIAALTGGDQNLNSLNWRYDQWAAAVALIGDRHATGIGWQQIPIVIADHLEAHSGYVEIWVELGVVGALLAAAGVAVLVRAAWPHLLPLMLIGVVLVSSATDPVLVYPSSLGTLLVLLACDRRARTEARTALLAPAAAVRLEPVAA